MSVSFTIEQCEWRQCEGALRQIREIVFIREQSVPVDLEWDGEDVNAIHLLAIADSAESIGCVRILSDGHIGRMAVLLPWRGQGIGQALLRLAIAVVRDSGCTEAILDAQTHAISFYEREGFVAEGAEFMDAGIPHRHMRCPL